jgi:hypothetical protein
MAGIEELAAALFREQEQRVADATLKAIFRSFVEDELRHSTVAQRLANFYDVHRYRCYRRNAALVAFAPCFVQVVRDVADDMSQRIGSSNAVLVPWSWKSSSAPEIESATAAEILHQTVADLCAHALVTARHSVVMRRRLVIA